MNEGFLIPGKMCAVFWWWARVFEVFPFVPQGGPRLGWAREGGPSYEEQ